MPNRRSNRQPFRYERKHFLFLQELRNKLDDEQSETKKLRQELEQNKMNEGKLQQELNVS